jgi:lysophospholipase L1-like esterase
VARKNKFRHFKTTNMKKLMSLIPILVFCFLLPAQAQTRVVCVGDSITAGWGLKDAKTEAYPAQLGDLLGSGYTVKNCGASGTCMVKGDVRATYWKTRQFQDALNFDPQIVIIKLGTNDGDPPRWRAHKNEFYDDYVAMIAEFRKNGKTPRIYACFPVPAFGPVKAPQGVVITNEVIPLIKQVIATQGVSLIDFNTPMLGHAELFQDGIHPTAEGAKRLAQIAFNSITGAAKKEDAHSSK